MESSPKRLPGDPPSEYEERWGYSRLVVSGPLISVAGTTSLSADGVVLGRTCYEQTLEIAAKIRRELARVDATLADVVRTRIYVTDISRGEEVGRAHQEAFGPHPPSATMVEVAALADERMLVEIEATAWRER